MRGIAGLLEESGRFEGSDAPNSLSARRRLCLIGRAVSFIVILLIVSSHAYAQLQDRYDLIPALMSKDKNERKEGMKAMLAEGSRSLVPGMVDAMFFTPRAARGELVKCLQEFTGEKMKADYYEWVEFVGRRSDIVPGHGYVEWKVSLLSRIDPQYKKVLYSDVTSRIRLEEIVWGGVPLDGIPGLENPPRVTAAESDHLRDDELVFGVSLGGEQVAYPLRYLSWHEMTNDEVGGEPITLSY